MGSIGSANILYVPDFIVPSTNFPKMRYFLTEVGSPRHVAIFATISDQGKERIIDVGRYIELLQPCLVRRAEIAITVDDEHKNLGFGTLLLEHLVRIARANGIKKLVAHMLPDNHRMFDIVTRLGCHIFRSWEFGVVSVALDIAGDSLSNTEMNEAQKVNPIAREIA